MLSDLRSSLPNATVRFYIDRIREVDRRLALVATSDAQAAGGNQQTITLATNEINEGDADVTNSKFEEAIEEYAEAWGLALRALRNG